MKCFSDADHIDMMTKERSDIVKMVYTRFIESEQEIWTDLDCNLEFMGYLTDAEMILECKAKFDKHCFGVLRCNQEHGPDKCLAPYILEAVEYILDLYSETGQLHPKNYYLLSYYLALSEMKMIFNEI